MSVNVKTMNDPIDNKPWYTHGWLWLVIALPFTAVVAGISTFFIAAHDPDSLVVDEYYKKGLAINEVLDREQQAADLGLKARMEFSDDKVRLHLEGVQPDQVVVKFIHPTRSQYDQEVILSHAGQGYYLASGLDGLVSVAWYVHVEDSDGTWRLQGRYNPDSGTALNLKADGLS
jgi:hypothetical protein